MNREDIKKEIDELMRQYDAGEITGAEYQEKVLELKNSL